jgi:hypothetical protein
MMKILIVLGRILQLIGIVFGVMVLIAITLALSFNSVGGPGGKELDVNSLMLGAVPFALGVIAVYVLGSYLSNFGNSSLIAKGRKTRKI